MKWLPLCVLFVPVLAASPASAVSPDKLDLVLLVDTSRSMQGVSKESLLELVDRFRSSQRLAVVTFGEKPEIVYQLSSATTDADRVKLAKVMGDLVFEHEFKDFPGGLATALDLLSAEGDKDATRVVILLSGGHLVPAHDYSTHDDVLVYLRQEVLYDYFLAKIPIIAVAYGADADLSVMREIGDSTRGRCLVAPDTTSLDDVLAVLLDGIQPPPTSKDESLVASPEKEAVPVKIRDEAPQDEDGLFVLMWILSVFVGLLVIVNVVVLVLQSVGAIRLRAVLGQKAVEKARPDEDEHPEFTSLRKKAARIAALVGDARARLDGFDMDLEDLGAQNWEREQTLRKQYQGLTESLFLLIDHMDLEAREGSRALDLDFFAQRTRKLLSAEGILEIPVREGDVFDGMYHKHAGDRKHQTPPGTVLEVVRKGYYLPRRKEGQDDSILRHAEVIVSKGERS